MKRLACVVVLLAFVACATVTSVAAGPKEIIGIKQEDVAVKQPGLFCKVVKEPNPLLLGGWKCVHKRFRPKKGTETPEDIQYWMGKFGDQYGLYFFRVKEGEYKKFTGWKEWTVNGDEIISGTGVRIFVKDGAVYYGWEENVPTKMGRMDNL